MQTKVLILREPMTISDNDLPSHDPVIVQKYDGSTNYYFTGNLL